MTETSATRSAPIRRALGRIGPGPAAILALVALELLIVSIAYKHFFVFECRAAAPAALCRFLSEAVIRAMVAAGAAALALAPHAVALGRFAASLAPRPPAIWILAQVAGFLAVMTPLAILHDGAGATTVAASFAIWLTGALMAVGGAMRALAAPAAWLRLARAGGTRLALAIGVAAFAPEIADFVQQTWRIEWLASLTFDGSAFLLRLFEDDVVSAPEEVLLGVGDFLVLVGPQCAGMEGFALIAGFLGLYTLTHRDRLIMGRAILLLPVCLLLSWVFNAARIAALILIGAHVSPELAVNGFHSHAGWLMFTLLSLGTMTVIHFTPWFHARPAARPSTARPLPPLTRDWNVARLAPFAAFMATALLASTFSQTPNLYYPLRFAATAAALAAFWPLLARLDWRVDPLAVVAGVAIGVGWVVTGGEASAGDAALAQALADAPAWFFVLWAFTRVIGTAVLVPVIEELAFRSYVMETFDLRDRLGAVAGIAIAVTVSTVLFAALHDRWVAAAAAGVVFAAIAYRRGRIVDAIWCHAAANALIAAWSLYTGDWSTI